MLFQKLVNKYTALALGVIVGLLLTLKQCDKKKVEEITNEKLEGKEKAAIIIDTNKGTVTTIRRKPGTASEDEDTASESTESVSIDDARDLRISIDKDGTTIVTARTKGFTFEPGVSVGEAEIIRAGVDVQWYFYKRFGVLSGLSLNLDRYEPRFSLYTGINYLPKSKYTQNTSFFIAYDTRRNIYFGIRIQL